MSDRPLSTAQMAIFTLPILGVEFIIYPTLAIMPAFYAALSGRDLGEFATAIFVSRLIYTWSGPLVGYLSDRIATPWGRRKPWMLLGLVVTLVSVVLLFFPPRTAGPAYFLVASSLALAAFSIIDIPYIAWGSEISRETAQRSRIASWRMIVASAALLLFLALPYVPGFGGSNLLDPHVIARLGFAAFAIITLTVLAALRFGPPSLVDTAVIARRETPGTIARAIATNGPFWMLAGATFFSYLSYALVLTLQFPFLESLGLVAQYGIIAIVGTIVSMASMAPWTMLAARIGNRRSWAYGLIATALAPLVYLLFAPATPLVAVIAVSIALNVGGVTLLLPYSAIGAVIDLDELRTGTNHSANYSGLLLVVIRSTIAVGGALGFSLLARFGVRIGHANTPTAQHTVLVLYFVLPALCNLAALAFVVLYPLTEQRHTIVRRRLARRIQLLENQN